MAPQGLKAHEVCHGKTMKGSQESAPYLPCPEAPGDKQLLQAAVGEADGWQRTALPGQMPHSE